MSKNNKIPTAKEFLKTFKFNYLREHNKNVLVINDDEIAGKAMIEFTRLHIEQALEIASKTAETKQMKVKHNKLTGSEFHFVRRIDKKSILRAYPKTNIL